MTGFLYLLVLSTPAQQVDPSLEEPLRRRADALDNLRIEAEWTSFSVSEGLDPWRRENWQAWGKQAQPVTIRYMIRRPDWRIDVSRGGQVQPTSSFGWLHGLRWDLHAPGDVPQAVWGGMVIADVRAKSGFLSSYPILTPLELQLFDFDYCLLEGVRHFGARPTGSEVVCGAQCISTESTKAQGPDQITWYFDPRLAYLPRCVRIITRLKNLKPMLWEYRCLDYREVDSVSLMTEVVIIVRNPNVSTRTGVYHWLVSSIAIEHIGDHDIAVHWPAETHVLDYPQMRRYVVGTDGAPTNIVPIDPEEEELFREALLAQVLTPEIRAKRRFTFAIILGISGFVGLGAGVCLIVLRRRRLTAR